MSRFVNVAIRHELEREHVRELLRALEDEMGPADPTMVREALMTEYVVLDAEAVSALAHPSERAASARRAQAILVVAEQRNALIRIPAAVLVEVYRGRARDTGVDRIAQVPDRVVPLDQRIARVAGRMLGRRGLLPLV